MYNYKTGGGDKVVYVRNGTQMVSLEIE